MNKPTHQVTLAVNDDIQVAALLTDAQIRVVRELILTIADEVQA